MRPLRIASPLTDEEELLMHEAIGCGIQVHRALGPGLAERFYRSAFCIELEAQGISYATEHPIALSYRGRALGIQRLDLLVGRRVVVELKAVERLESVHRAQLLSYLRTARLRAGLLLNFNAAILTIRRCSCEHEM
jgi:GxxExxY protein